jgi:uncharacterized protein (DUF1697 family)
MKDLTALLEAQGFAAVRTYIQSGNVVFRSAGSGAVLTERMRAAVAGRFGFRPQLVLLQAAQLARAAAANPFPEAQAQPGYLHLWFLQEKPAAAGLASLETLAAATERLALRGSVLYLHAPEGIGNSKLAARAESCLGVSGTARNWRTVTALLELARAAR